MSVPFDARATLRLKGRQQIVRWMTKVFRSQHPVVLCGAGVSKNSGLPVATELADEILLRLSASARDRATITRKRLPFEAFMECVAEYRDISELLQIFSRGAPNATHLFVASLARNERLTFLATTNFDLLLERALLKHGLRARLDYAVAATERELDGWARRPRRRRLALLKLHGSIDNEQSIRTTLRAVASRQLRGGRERALAALLGSVPAAPLIVLGYSGSDAFDITPILQRLSTMGVPVIYVEHRSGRVMRTTSLTALGTENPFHAFKGVRVVADTDVLIASLWRKLLRAEERPRSAMPALAWADTVSSWSWTTPHGVKHLILAKLLFQTSQPRRAITSCTRALPLLRQRVDSPKQAACLTLQGQAFHTLGKYQAAITCLNKALRCRLPRGSALRCSILEKLGGVNHNLGNYILARAYYRRALRIAQRRKDVSLESLCHSGLGSVCYRLGALPHAKAHYRRALVLAQRIGFKAGEAAYALNLANVYAAEGLPRHARNAYERAITTAALIRYRVAEMTARIGLADLDFGARRLSEASAGYRAALRAASVIGYRVRILDCHLGLGRVKLASRDA